MTAPEPWVIEEVERARREREDRPRAELWIEDRREPEPEPERGVVVIDVL